MKKKAPWSRVDKLTAVAAVVAVVAVGSAFFVPEVRRFLGLEKPADVSRIARVQNSLSPTSDSLSQRAPVTATQTPRKTKTTHDATTKVNGNGNVAGNTVGGSGNTVGNDNHPIVIDAPGGMPIVGNTGIINNPTVNNFRPPERTIEAKDETDLISALAQHPGKITFGALGTDPNSESQRFAQKLQQLFRAAGWTMLEQGIVPMYNSQTWSGVEVDAKGNLTDPVPITPQWL